MHARFILLSKFKDLNLLVLLFLGIVERAIIVNLELRGVDEKLFLVIVYILYSVELHCFRS